MTDETEIKPEEPIWKKWWFWVIAIFVIIFIASAGGGDKKEIAPIVEKSAIEKEAVEEKPKAEQVRIEQEEAEKNLKDFLEIFVKSGLIKNAETGKIYVSNAWFTLDVPFKENFLTLAYTILKNATGSGYIEVRHYQSNELLGKATVWSIEVKR